MNDSQVQFTPPSLRQSLHFIDRVKIFERVNILRQKCQEWDSCLLRQVSHMSVGAANVLTLGCGAKQMSAAASNQFKLLRKEAIIHFQEFNIHRLSIFYKGMKGFQCMHLKSGQ